MGPSVVSYQALILSFCRIKNISLKQAVGLIRLSVDWTITFFCKLSILICDIKFVLQ